MATFLLVPSSPMDSSRVVIDLSLKTMEPTGRISDYNSSRKFLLDFRRYRQTGGSKKLSTLLQVSLDPKKPLIRNLSSLFFEFDDNYLFNDDYIENKLLSVFPDNLASLCMRTYICGLIDKLLYSILLLCNRIYCTSGATLTNY